MIKTLGLDLGTNSLGWAVTTNVGDQYTLVEQGVDIFQDGVAHDKSGEKPAVQERTAARALRRHYFRRRLRKIEVLKVLIAQGLCPELTKEQLQRWRAEKVYPLTEEFIQWQRTDDNQEKNPYRDRYLALTTKLDLSKEADRHSLGRALYHLAQRRGFLSNRKESTKESDGEVKQEIQALNAEIADAGCSYLGEYFYQLHCRQEKIRGKYTSRNEHYKAEFDAICRKQNLPEELVTALAKAIFFQRPLKSQKWLVGKCTFERTKSRCPSSHPRFEEFRMRSFINNIRIKAPGDTAPRPLNELEIKAITPLFLRKSKPRFDFEEIAKRLSGKKGTYAYQGDRGEAPFRFNFKMKTSVSGAPVTGGLVAIFGDEWLPEICRRYAHKAQKNDEQILCDVWHALFAFDDDEKLHAWAKSELQLDDEQATAFTKIAMPQDYAALSLNAINKILPYLRIGLRYDEAVFLANLGNVIPAPIWQDTAQRESIMEGMISVLDDFAQDPLNDGLTKVRALQNFLSDNFNIDFDRSEKLYHPSMIETYQQVLPDKDKPLQLGSPRTSAIRNPMAMRALFRLRILINKLLREGKIDRMTKINIEFARGLNDANKRKAIEWFQRENEKRRAKYAVEIAQLFLTETGRTIAPSDDDILKYQCWMEQKQVCLYTGESIRIQDFIGANPSYDIEHTVPRSRGGDNSQMNKTLCKCSFNREIKRAKLPSELANHAQVLARIEALGWKEQIEELTKQIEQTKGTFSTKEIKDAKIQRRHFLKMQRTYLEGKYNRMIMTEVPEGFANRQGVDIGIIGKYARLYLKTVFERIYTIKGATTDEFRKMWGLQEEYEKKARTNHTHHCIDAVTIACIGRGAYDKWAQHAGDTERYEWGESRKPSFEKPWPSFTEDVKAIAEELLIAHHTPDNMPKQSRKRLRIRGKVQSNKQGEPIYMQGDTARSSLHMQTFYGAIKRDDQIKYVVRKSLGQLTTTDIDKIVDEVVRQRVKDAIDASGFKEALAGVIWMNEAKGIPINKVRIFTPSVTSPIHLKPQRDLSAYDYKHDYHVTNDGNYCMAIYEGTDAKGKTKRSFKVVNNLEAANHFKCSTDKEARPDLVPLSDANDMPLKCLLKTGTMLLFYQTSPEELHECSKRELVKRLYKVTGMSTLTSSPTASYGRLTVKHHQEARVSGELTAKNGVWTMGEEYRPVIGILHTQLNAYVEGYDFELTVTGEVQFKR